MVARLLADNLHITERQRASIAVCDDHRDTDRESAAGGPQCDRAADLVLVRDLATGVIPPLLGIASGRWSGETRER
jgi:hypothetical protein